MQKQLVGVLVASIALAASSSAHAQAPAGTATLRYNPATGNVVFNIGSGLGVVGVESVGNVKLGLPISPPPQQYDANIIAYFNPSGIPPVCITLARPLRQA